MPARRQTEAAEFHDGIITALVARQGQPDRVHVYLDGRSTLQLASAVVDQAGLRVGDRLTVERQRDLRILDTPFRAREQALRLLAVRDRSQREVEIRLRQAGFEPAVVTQTVTRLRDLDYLDDRRFAARYAAEKRRTGWASRRIRAELAGKGVERSIVDETLAALEEEPVVAAEGREVLELSVRRRFSAQFSTDPGAAERRLSGFLARRGYDWDTIGQMARMLREEASAKDSPSSLP